MNDAAPDAQRRRNRLTLLAILVLFFGSMLVAGVMRFADIHPAASRQKGELLDPYTDLREARLRTTAGEPYEWSPIHRVWRIVVPAPAECGEACRANGVTLGHSLGGVAYRIQRVGDVADGRWQLRHFGNPACIVSNGAVSIECHDNTRHGQHGSCGNRNTIQAGQVESSPDTQAND